MVIRVPVLPNRKLSPNGNRVHWAVLSRVKQDWKDAVYYSALKEKNGTPIKAWEPLKHARLSLTFVYATNRTRDADNLVAMFKYGQDMLVSAGIIEADDVRHLQIASPEVVVDKKAAPMTIIKVEEVAAVGTSSYAAL